MKLLAVLFLGILFAWNLPRTIRFCSQNYYIIRIQGFGCWLRLYMLPGLIRFRSYAWKRVSSGAGFVHMNLLIPACRKTGELAGRARKWWKDNALGIAQLMLIALGMAMLWLSNTLSRTFYREAE